MKKGGLFRRHTDSKKKTTRGKVFGVSLTEVCTREQSALPAIAEETIEYLENRGLDKEGIFRIPGNDTVLQQLKAFYDGEQSDMTLENCDDVHAVAGLLKLYLRELPEPLLTHRFYDTFITIQKNPDPMYRMTHIRKFISALPADHKVLLTRLCSFLIQVAKYSDKNKMNEANLAIVLGPNLLRPRHESMLRMIEDARHVNGVIQSLLEEYEFLVSGEASKPQKEENQSHGTTEETYTDDSDLKPIEEELNDADSQNSGRTFVTPVSSEENGRAIPTPSPPEFDLENPLDFAIGKLKQIYHKESRPFNLDQMNPAQRKQERADIKWQLRNYDLAFQARYGHLPTKQDKEILRPLYERYRSLADVTEQEDEELPAPAIPDPLVLPLEANEEYKKLKEEKRSLQRYLHQYQMNFIAKNRRRMQYLQDREPVKKEYNEYKLIKQKLQLMEAAAKRENV